MKRRWEAFPLADGGRKRLWESEEVSGTYLAPGYQSELSFRYWGRALAHRLPCQVSGDGVRATRGQLSRIREFIARECPSLAEEALGAVTQQPLAAAKQSYFQSACDLIELRHEDRTIGVFVGAPEDWSTYYVRAFAMTRAHQRSALMRRFARECVFEPLAACGVQRVVADTSPANLAMSRLFSELHFYVTGQQLSERWGPLVRYTRFLDPACEALFMQRFGGTAPTVQG